MSVMRELLIFSSGVAIGVAVGMKVLEKKYADQFEQAVDDKVNELHEEEVMRKEEEEKRKLNEQHVSERVQYNKLVGTYRADRGAEMVSEDRKEETVTEEASNDDTDKKAGDPYEITEDDFDASNGYSKGQYYYYKDSHTLVNDEDEVINNADEIRMMFGEYIWSNIQEDNDFLGRCCIRNEMMDADYCIDIMRGTYPPM